MSRVKRLQRYLNAKHKAKLDVDGRFGPMTLGAIEDALGVEAWSKANQPKLKSEFDARTELNLGSLDRKAEPTMRKLVRIAQAVASEKGVGVGVISGNRTWAEQDALYAKGRTKPGRIVTNARGGYSNHNFGIAIDFGVFRNGRYLDGGTAPQKQLAASVYEAIAEAAKDAALPVEWGGDWRTFKDYPHFEIRTGLSMAHKRNKYLEEGTVL